MTDEAMALPPSTLTTNQVRKFVQSIPGEAFAESEPCHMRIDVRHDDHCGNGHNTFSITGEVWATVRRGGERYKKGAEPITCGMIHDTIAEHANDHIVDALRWHLTSTDGPMHYLADTLYLAGDKDHSGRRKGEPSSFETAITFGDNPILYRPGSNWVANKFIAWIMDQYERGGESYMAALKVERIRHREDGESLKRSTYSTPFAPKWTIGGFGERWHDCPFDTETEARRFMAAMRDHDPKRVRYPVAWSEGKAPDLDGARRAAMWPNGTLEQLQDREALVARLPGLMAEFKATVESFGFTY